MRDSTSETAWQRHRSRLRINRAVLFNQRVAMTKDLTPDSAIGRQTNSAEAEVRAYLRGFVSSLIPGVVVGMALAFAALVGISA
jgi:hypothetical protein